MLTGDGGKRRLGSGVVWVGTVLWIGGGGLLLVVAANGDVRVVEVVVVEQAWL